LLTGASNIASSFRGVLAKRVSAGTLNTNSAIAYDAEEYDTASLHSTASNTTRFVVPAGASYARVTAAMKDSGTGGAGCYIHKNGSLSFLGRGLDMKVISGHAIYPNPQGGIAKVVPGDYFEAVYGNGGFSVQNANGNWAAMEIVDPSEACCMLGRGDRSGQALATGSFPAGNKVEWGDPAHATNVSAGSYDLGGYWSVAEPTRITIPVGGAGWYRVMAGINYPTSQANTRILVNNAELTRKIVSGGDRMNSQQYHTVGSYAMYLNDGDYIEAQMEVSTAGTLGGTNLHWFSLEKVPSTRKRVLLGWAGSKTFTSGGTLERIVTFDTEVYDTADLADLVASNSRVVVPAGVSRVRAMLGTGLHGAAGKIEFTIRKNGLYTPGLPINSVGNATLWESANMMSAWIDVVPGDYIDVSCNYNENARTFAAGNAPWLYVEAE
jgi:hypothetical protein